MRRYGRVVLGGTFDGLHAGHEALLATAFRLGRSVAIGLTTEAFLAQHPKPRGGAITPEASRRRRLARWLRRRYPAHRWTITPIDDRLGRAAEPGFDALVVSADTVDGGRAVNRERRRRGRPPLPLIVVPLVLADDLEPLSSRRIRAGEVDRLGHVRGPIEVGLGVLAREDAGPATRGLHRAFPKVRVTRVAGPRHATGSVVSLSRLALAARGPRPLGVAIGRWEHGGWSFVLRGRRVALGPLRIEGRTPRDLEWGVARCLRPGPLRRSTD